MVRSKVYFDILNRLRVTHECDGQTDRQRDILLANAALKYFAQPKSTMTTRMMMMMMMDVRQ